MNKILYKSLLLSLLILGINSLNAQVEFISSPDEEHSFFIIPGKVIDLNEYRGSVTKYVWRYHAKDRLKINNILIGGDNKTEVIHISSFKNKAHAMGFYQHMKEKFPDFLHMNMTRSYFAVSKSNYEAILKNYGFGTYEDYFKEHYLSK
jgi:hypothetical protein